MIFIDANIFLAYDNQLDVHHTRAVKLWEEIESGKYEEGFISDYVFNEVVGVTFRKFDKERARMLGKNILKSMVLLNIDEHMLTEAWTIFRKTQLGLNLVDCTNLVALKAVSTIYIATFDEEFKNVSGIVVIC